MNRLAFVYIAILGLCIWSLILHFLAPTAVPSLLNVNSPVARVVGVFLVVVAGCLAFCGLVKSPAQRSAASHLLT